MDQALKSALDKYNGKLGVTTQDERSSILSKAFVSITIIIAVALVFSVCIKYDFLSAGVAWSRIKNIDVGNVSIGSLIEGVEERISSALSSGDKTTVPVNQSGESGSAQTEIDS